MNNLIAKLRSMLNRLRETLFKGLFRARFRYDVFISYSHRDAKKYAANLKQQLGNLDFSCFIDEEESPPGSSLDPTLAKALKKSAVLVLLATERALTRPYIVSEFEKFAATERTIVPINILGALTNDDEAALSKVPWNLINDRKLVWIDETDDAFAKQNPSPHIADGIDKLFKYTRRNTRVRTEIVGTAMLVVLAALGAGFVIKGQAREVTKQATLAEAARKETAIEQNRAVEAGKQAQRELDRAAEATREAERQGEIAKTAEEEAKRQQEIATAASAEAERQLKLAEAAKAEAERQQTIARQLMERNRRFLYDSAIAMSEREYAAGNLDQAQSMLDTLVPAANQTDLRGFEWHYLSNLYHRESKGLEAHRRDVTSLAYSPDGKLFATGSGRLFKLWDSATFNLVGTLGDPSREGGKTAIAFSRDGRIVTSEGGTFKVWDVSSRKLLGTLEEYKGYIEGDTAVAFSPNNQIIATGFDQYYKLWDANSLRLIATIGTESEGHALTSAATALAFSPDGKSLAILVMKDKTFVELWDVASRTLISRASGNRTDVPHSVSFSPDGKKLIVVDDLGVASFNTADLLTPSQASQPDKEFRGPTTSGSLGFMGNVLVAFSPDGLSIATGVTHTTRGGGVKLWDLASFKLLATFDGLGLNGQVGALSFSRDSGKLLIAAEQKVQLSDASRDPNVEWIPTPGFRERIVFSPDGKKLVASGLDGEGHMWTFDASRGRLTAASPLNFERIAFSPDSKQLATVGTWTVNILDAETRRLITSFGKELDYENRPSTVAFSPQGNIVALGCGGGVIQWWDIATHTRLDVTPKLESRGVSDEYRQLIFSPDGKLLAALPTTYAAQVLLFDAVSHRLVAFVPNVDDNAPLSIAFSPDSKTLAVGRINATTELWDINSLQTGNQSKNALAPEPGSGRLLAVFAGHSEGVSAVAFSPDGRTLATGSRDRTIKLWSTDSHQLFMTLEYAPDDDETNTAGRNAVMTVNFSPDGQTLVAGGNRNGIKLWRALRK